MSNSSWMISRLRPALLPDQKKLKCFSTVGKRTDVSAYFSLGLRPPAWWTCCREGGALACEHERLIASNYTTHVLPVQRPPLSQHHTQSNSRRATLTSATKTKRQWELVLRFVSCSLPSDRDPRAVRCNVRTSATCAECCTLRQSPYLARSRAILQTRRQ